MLVGQALKKARERKGLRQKELAEMLFVDPSLVSRWEKDERKIPIVLFVQILDILEISIDEFKKM
jgi:transcriptional regulator with XRE-family HTH domain